MSYTVLARRYRSRDFDELVGQEPIARTLKNAIAADRTAHAYLFCGTRGVGKTSLARIFAKAINVSSDLEEADAIAEAVLRGDDLDVIEIDAASNRGIQEAKDLIAGAGLSPTRCKNKIYIIDEVHMLTREAFNALLKTMEEPPKHVKFILCTTDPHKVPATIQSRCQRFDFRAIPTPQIAAQLRHILAEEGIEAEEEVIRQVARLGDGSMRDALSLLDRLLASGEGTLTMEQAEQLLGLPEDALLFGLVDAIVAGEPRGALEAGAELLARGATVEQALELLTEHFRTLLLVAACGADSDLLDLSTEMREGAAEQAERFDVEGLVYLIALCDATARNARGTASSRALFDAAIVRMCLAEHLADVAGLLAGRLEGKAPEGSGAAPPRKKKGEAAPPRARVSPGAEAVSAPAPASGPAAALKEPMSSASSAPAAPVPVGEPGAAVVEVKPPGRTDEPQDGAVLWDEVAAAAAGAPGDLSFVQGLVYHSFERGLLRLVVDESAAPRARFLVGQGERVKAMVEKATGRHVRIEIEPPATGVSRRTTETSGSEADMAVRSLPVVRKAMDLFDAVVTEVHDDTPETSGNHS